MSGHSKWSTIKRRKEANDAKRGRLFTKLAHEIVVAVREGGEDPEYNFRLRLALDRATDANMPKDNIQRAIDRGTGRSLDGKGLEEGFYEGYGPEGIALMIHYLTDNRNRAVSDIRHVLSTHGGNLGSDGCVSWMFSRRGYLSIEAGEADAEEVALEAIDAGAEDVEIDEGVVEVYTTVGDFKAVSDALEEAGFEVDNAELLWDPQTTKSLPEKDTMKVMRLVEALEDLLDVQDVYSNLDLQDEMIEKYESEQAA
ncbi:MAG: YebC/PmpR family DNA-binding transcriptional regulator [Chloroflexota bacterium]|nr:YebC/PmpR family DNA-binding transcriptional regulator [Chloroflexota bacterium]